MHLIEKATPTTQPPTNFSGGPTTKPKNVVAAQDIATLVPMADLLSVLAISVNTRSRRAPCVLHKGSNPTAFSWTDNGCWFCFHCGKGGDKFTLVQEVRKCNFLDALRFLAALAGIEWSSLNTDEVRRELAEAKKKAERVKAATKKLQRLEKHLLLDARKEVLGLHRLRRNAGARLAALRRGQQPRFIGEECLAWDALELVARNELAVSAKYLLLAFGAPTVRSRYALHPEQRRTLVEEVLLAGAVVDEKGRVMEVSA